MREKQIDVHWALGKDALHCSAQRTVPGEEGEEGGVSLHCLERAGGARAPSHCDDPKI